MRLSVDTKDPGFDPVKSIHHEVFLDSKKLDMCITADTDKGEAVIILLDQLDKEKDLVRKTLYGKVEIREMEE